MNLVLDDRRAGRAADLLVLIRQPLDGHRIRGVEAVVAEESVDAARGFVGPRARNRLDFDARRAALRDVEHVGDDLEFSDRFAAELRLAEARASDLLRNLLAVQVELEGIVAAPAWRVRDVVGCD